MEPKIYEFKVEYGYYKNGHIKVLLIDQKKNFGKILYEITKDYDVLTKIKNYEDYYINFINLESWIFIEDLIKKMELATIEKNKFTSDCNFPPLYKFKPISFETIDSIFRIIVHDNKIIDFDTLEEDNYHILNNKLDKLLYEIKLLNQPINNQDKNFNLKKNLDIHTNNIDTILKNFNEKEDIIDDIVLLDNQEYKQKNNEPNKKRRIVEKYYPVREIKRNRNNNWSEYSTSKKIKLDLDDLVDKIYKEQFEIIEDSNNRKIEITF